MQYDVVVVGGGIVGLATAYELLKKKPGLKLLLLEKENRLSAHQTGNNSGVIHSGLYYKPGSLKATNCINGYHKLIAFAEEENIPYEICGKLVVATKPEQVPIMEGLFERGKQNGLDGLKVLQPEAMAEIEPHVKGLAGIRVPQTGIIDYKAVSEAIGRKIEQAGGEIKLGHKVTGMRKSSNGYEVVCANDASFNSSYLVSCSGLYSDRVAKMNSKDVDLKIIPFRGEYFKLKPESQHLVKHLIYPVPDPNFPFLGVHFTRMIGGGIEAGPNAVLAFRREGYTKADIHLGELLESLTYPGFIKVATKYWQTGLGEMYRSFSKAAFTKALQGLIPEIKASDLEDGGAGVRAQACDRQGGLLDDFKIIESDRAVNVCNAPSPAATSSLSIGDTVSGLMLKKMG